MRKLFDRTPAEAAVVLQSLKAVATAEGRLAMDAVHLATLKALREHVLRAQVDVGRLPVGLPEELERRILDAEIRANLLHLAIVLPLLEPEHEAERAAVVRAIARRFRATDGAVADATAAARRRCAHLVLDASRGSRAGIRGTSLERSLLLCLRDLPGRDPDPELAARVHAFAAHPEGTVGRTLLAYWRDNALGLPGEPGSIESQLLFEHDVHHVLTGYDTSPRGELALAGFLAGLAGKDDAGFTATLLLHLQVAVQADPTGGAWREPFDAATYLAALERAAGCTTDLASPAWDPWSVVDLPLEEARAALGIAADGAMVRGPSDRWCGALGPPGKRLTAGRVAQARP